MTARVVVRPDILAGYGDLFGSKHVPSGAVVVEALIASLVSEIESDLRHALSARYERQARVARTGGVFDFADPTEMVRDADGHRANRRRDPARHARRLFRASHRRGLARRITCADSGGGRASGPRGHRAVYRPRNGLCRDQQRRLVVDVGLGRRRRRLSRSAVSRMAESQGDSRRPVGQPGLRAPDETRAGRVGPPDPRQAAHVRDQDSACRVAGHFSPRAGGAFAKPADHPARRGRAGHGARARDPRAQQLRVAATSTDRTCTFTSRSSNTGARRGS